MCVCVCVCACVRACVRARVCVLKKKKKINKLGKKSPKSHWERGRISAPEDTKKKSLCLFNISIEANIVDPDQTAPTGAA